MRCLRRLPAPDGASTASIAAFLEYEAEMRKEDADIDLLKCAALIAKHRYPDLDVARVYTHVDTMAAAVRDRLPEEMMVRRLCIAFSGIDAVLLGKQQPTKKCLHDQPPHRLVGGKIALSRRGDCRLAVQAVNIAVQQTKSRF